MKEDILFSINKKKTINTPNKYDIGSSLFEALSFQVGSTFHKLDY
jgi:hypothetical protein